MPCGAVPCNRLATLGHTTVVGKAAAGWRRRYSCHRQIPLQELRCTTLHSAALHYTEVLHCTVLHFIALY